MNHTHATQSAPHMVVIGGGTGSFALLSGLKRHSTAITALVNMADDGGSTGVLRDELGVLPPGDVRQCLVALSDSSKLRDLFTYRFEEGTFKGHAFGNLFLTALEKMSGSFAEAVELAGEVLNITGRVEPITLTNVTLCARGGGETVCGQFAVKEATFTERPRLWLEPEAALNPRARQAIEEADIVVIAPGDLYDSLAPALIVPGIAAALRASKAVKVYVCNLVTKPHTLDFTVHDFASEIERFVGEPFLDYVLYNSKLPDSRLLQRYASEGEFGVQLGRNEVATEYTVVRADVIAAEVSPKPQASDPIARHRSYIRHDPAKVAQAIMDLL